MFHTNNFISSSIILVTEIWFMGFKFKVGREAQGAFKLYKLTINLFAWINWLFVFYIISFIWNGVPFITQMNDSLQVSLSLNIRKGSHLISEMLQYAVSEKLTRRVTNSSSFHAALRSLSFADCIETRIQNWCKNGGRHIFHQHDGNQW